MKNKSEVGMWIRRGTKGIWQLTKIEKTSTETKYWYGGMCDWHFDPDAIISKYKVKRMLNLTSKFKIGDLVAGLRHSTSKPVIGYIDTIFRSSFNHKIWIKDHDGRTIPLIDGTTKKVKLGKTVKIFKEDKWY